MQISSNVMKMLIAISREYEGRLHIGDKAVEAELYLRTDDNRLIKQVLVKKRVLPFNDPQKIAEKALYMAVKQMENPVIRKSLPYQFLGYLNII